MIKVSDAILAIIRGNPFLEFGVHHQLFNSAQLARYLQPFIAARTHTDTKESAIAMALSRLASGLVDNTPEPTDFQFQSVNVTAGLCTASFTRTMSAHRAVNRLQTEMFKKEAFCSVSEGMKEVTVIVENRFQQRLLALVEEQPVYQHTDLASVEIYFGSTYTNTPGMLYMLLQRAALQNINLIEITSTCSGLTMFIAEKDTRRLFDTLMNSMEGSDATH